MIDRRRFLKGSVAAAVAAGMPMGWVIRSAGAVPAAPGLADPAWTFDSAAFSTPVPNALGPSFIYQPGRGGVYEVGVGAAKHSAGLLDAYGSAQPLMDIYGYGAPPLGPTWPGRTFEIFGGVDLPKNESRTFVRWLNNLTPGNDHFLPVDTSLHWAYALHGYTGFDIATNGVPIITHLHGGRSDFSYDGNPEFFYNHDYSVIGPQWANVGGGFTNLFKYDADVPAGTLWYHDHALGITRLNVYAGMAGFYIVRDSVDTGDMNNGLSVPCKPYERLYAIQDRMFTADGQLFAPAFPGDPFYADFILGEAIDRDGDGYGDLPTDVFPGGGPSALAEFFGDHMIVNGKAWPVEHVEPRNYRMRLLNGTDSRFMALEFYEVPAGAKGFSTTIQQLSFTVIGSDQGAASSPTTVDQLVSEPGSRYDIVVDFSNVTPGNRVIMKNIGGDEPFGGDIPGPQVFGYTDRVMAFDVDMPMDGAVPDLTPLIAGGAAFSYNVRKPEPETRTRKVALFEGKDEYGRLQPLLGTAEPATDWKGKSIVWPATPEYAQAVLPAQDGTGTGVPHPLVGPMEGSIAWHSPTTENPAYGATEVWEIWNMTGDAHPVHLHLVNFEVLGRQEITFDTAADADGFIPPMALPNDDGVYLVPQPTVQHNSLAGDPATYGIGFRIVHPSNDMDAYGPLVPPDPAYVENAPKDMVTALPGQITRIRAKFEKKGRYVWHCHILSHEDHEMMRVLHVGPGA